MSKEDFGKNLILDLEDLIGTCRGQRITTDEYETIVDMLEAFRYSVLGPAVSQDQMKKKQEFLDKRKKSGN